MTPAEAQLWKNLRRNRLGGLHFRRQQIIEGFIADFYCHAAKLVIEADGSVHDLQTEYDEERTQIFAGHGIRVARFSNTRILHETAEVLAEILALAKTPPPTAPDPPPGGRGGEP